MRTSIPLCTAVFAVASLPAQLTIADGNTAFTSGPLSPTSHSPRSLALRADALAVNHGFEHWWYYRVAGDTRESAFLDVGPVAEAVTTQGTHMDRDFDDVDARGLLRARLDYDAYDTGPASGVVLSRLTLQNVSGSPVTFDVFCYNDLDVAGTFGDDSVSGDGNSHFVTDASGVRIELRATGNDKSDLGAYPSIRTLLTNTAVDDLADTLPPFTGDYTGAFQWQSRTLQPRECRTFTVVFAIDTPASNPPAIESYGVGSAIGPEIHTDSLPLQDNAGVRYLDVHFRGGPPFRNIGLLGNIFPAPGTLYLGLVNIWVDPFMPAQFPIGLTGIDGATFYTYIIPPSPYLTGYTIYHQWFFEDPSAPNGIAGFTNGLATRLGRL